MKQTEAAQAVSNAGYTIFGPVILDHVSEAVAIEIFNAGANPLTELITEAMDHPDGEWYSLLATTAYATASAIVAIPSIGTPATLAAGAKAHIHLRPPAVYALRFKAKSALATSVSLLAGVYKR